MWDFSWRKERKVWFCLLDDLKMTNKATKTMFLFLNKFLESMSQHIRSNWIWVIGLSVLLFNSLRPFFCDPQKITLQLLSLILLFPVKTLCYKKFHEIILSGKTWHTYLYVAWLQSMFRIFEKNLFECFKLHICLKLGFVFSSFIILQNSSTFWKSKLTFSNNSPFWHLINCTFLAEEKWVHIS